MTTNDDKQPSCECTLYVPTTMKSPNDIFLRTYFNNNNKNRAPVIEHFPAEQKAVKKTQLKRKILWNKRTMDIQS